MVISLKIDGIKKSFNNNIILKDASLEAKSSDIIGLIGKSGCGKSTLLKTLVGHYKPDSGKILLNKKNISKDLIGLRKMVGYTTQENSFYEKLTVIENMRYYANLYGIKHWAREKRITDLLKQVDLAKSRDILAENISGGMKRRLDFAISLLHDPSILILDEPTTGLDPILVEQFWEIVMEVRSNGDKIVIMSSHVLSEIEKYCNRVAVIKDGKVAKVLEKNEVKGLEKNFRAFVEDKEK